MTLGVAVWFVLYTVVVLAIGFVFGWFKGGDDAERAIRRDIEAARRGDLPIGGREL